MGREGGYGSGLMYAQNSTRTADCLCLLSAARPTDSSPDYLQSRLESGMNENCFEMKKCRLFISCGVAAV